MTAELTTAELVLLNNALNEILNGPNAIEGSEFHTRSGATREDAFGLLDVLDATIRARPDYPWDQSSD